MAIPEELAEKIAALEPGENMILPDGRTVLMKTLESGDFAECDLCALAETDVCFLDEFVCTDAFPVFADPDTDEA